jgi:hypothetical protein
MTRREWETCDDAVALVKLGNSALDDSALRQFAYQCCRRAIPLFPNSLVADLLAFGERRASEFQIDSELKSMRDKCTELYDSVYPGYGAPSPRALVLSAVGEIAFTESALKATTNACTTAAEAVAVAAGLAAPESQYDWAHDKALAKETAAQAAIFRSLFPNLAEQLQLHD